MSGKCCRRSRRAARWFEEIGISHEARIFFVIFKVKNIGWNKLRSEILNL
jgi:hypothetical protein